uniref:Uncharacterized protein n=1 Tax=Anguilla anguilla TaxID=7936 RepID=A0A0E9S7X8_ANGAN
MCGERSGAKWLPCITRWVLHIGGG